MLAERGPGTVQGGRSAAVGQSVPQVDARQNVRTVLTLAARLIWPVLGQLLGVKHTPERAGRQGHCMQGARQGVSAADLINSSWAACSCGKCPWWALRLSANSAEMAASACWSSTCCSAACARLSWDSSRLWRPSRARSRLTRSSCRTTANVVPHAAGVGPCPRAGGSCAHRSLPLHQASLSRCEVMLPRLWLMLKTWFAAEPGMDSC